MTPAQLAPIIDLAWEQRTSISAQTQSDVREAVETVLSLLDSGQLRVAEKTTGQWQVQQWVKKAILLSFRLNDSRRVSGGPQGGSWWDKVPSKFANWQDADFATAGFRAVPNCVVRRGAYVAANAVLMPSFVNIGAYVGEGTMIDTWATVGSCAQIGRNC
ncbi:MAG: 2,3,4,5-tetrahydropyridine-2,6-dicarboxylate N-succinyltransferase, partial [Proteobacteria bacterium]|nr:2,3,4,5-tetrahydropyridine-2,6-dicarboxylate N-succinyltransferase [Pseudomonadota bacterium]